MRILKKATTEKQSDPDGVSESAPASKTHKILSFTNKTTETECCQIIKINHEYENESLFTSSIHEMKVTQSGLYFIFD